MVTVTIPCPLFTTPGAKGRSRQEDYEDRGLNGSITRLPSLKMCVNVIPGRPLYDTKISVVTSVWHVFTEKPYQIIVCV